MEKPRKYTEPTLADALRAPSGDALAHLSGHPDANRFDNFYPPRQEHNTPSTAAAIEDFLQTFGTPDDSETATLERLIFNPVPDYSQQLAREEASSLPDAPAGAPSAADTPDDRINRFILSHHSPAQAAAPAAAPAAASAQPQQASSSYRPCTADHPTRPTEAQAPAQPATPAPAQPATPARAKGAAAQAPDGLLSESLAKIYVKTHRYEAAYEILSHLNLRFPEKSAYFADQMRFLQKLILIEKLKQQ